MSKKKKKENFKYAEYGIFFVDLNVIFIKILKRDVEFHINPRSLGAGAWLWNLALPGALSRPSFKL